MDHFLCNINLNSDLITVRPEMTAIYFYKWKLTFVSVVPFDACTHSSNTNHLLYQHTKRYCSIKNKRFLCCFRICIPLFYGI